MTFRQILDVLWLRKFLILAVVVVAAVSGLIFIQVEPKSYESDATIRTSAIVRDAGDNGSLGGVQVDFDSGTITSTEVLSNAANLAGEPDTDYSNVISTTVTPGSETDTVIVAATAPSPQLSQRRANAVVKAYTSYLQQQIDDAVVTLKSRANAANALATEYQKQAFEAPNNAVIAANLSNALTVFSTITNEITTIQNSGSPVTTLTAAPLGFSLGPGAALIIILALVAGVIAGIGIALIRDQFDNRLRGDYEIEPLTGLPSLGELVLDRGVAKNGEALPASRSEQTTLGEGLRSLRTTMQVLLPRHNAVVVFSSVEPGDGKTFVSANIAVAWARTGKKVILVGGDLRRPSLTTYFGDAARGSGLIEILQDADENGVMPRAADIIARLKDTDHRGLLLLPAGERDADPADLLATEGLKSVINALRVLADIVIIDTPPAMALVDASLLAEQSDGVILISGINRTDRTFLVDTLEVLRQNGATTLGVVTNRSRRSLPKSYAPYYARATQAPRVAEHDAFEASETDVERAESEKSQRDPVTESESTTATTATTDSSPNEGDAKAKTRGQGSANRSITSPSP